MEAAFEPAASLSARSPAAPLDFCLAFSLCAGDRRPREPVSTVFYACPATAIAETRSTPIPVTPGWGAGAGKGGFGNPHRKRAAAGAFCVSATKTHEHAYVGHA